MAVRLVTLGREILGNGGFFEGNNYDENRYDKCRQTIVCRPPAFILMCFLYHEFADELGEACRVVQGDSGDELGLAV